MLTIFLIQGLMALCQSVRFTYDSNGNRISRSIVVQQLQSENLSFPVLNPKSLLPAENATASSTDKTKKESIRSEGQDITVKVYPNPNKGLIKVDIPYMPLNSQSTMTLYDLSGNKLINKKGFGTYTELDISRLRNGIYILRLKINGKVTDFKVIKN